MLASPLACMCPHKLPFCTLRRIFAVVLVIVSLRVYELKEGPNVPRNMRSDFIYLCRRMFLTAQVGAVSVPDGELSIVGGSR